MKKIFVLILILVGFLFACNVSARASEELNSVNIYVFTTEGCPKCSKLKKYLDEKKEEYENINLFYYDANKNKDMYYEVVRDVFGLETSSVPFIVIGGKSIIGYSSSTKYYLDYFIEKYSNEEFVDVFSKYLNGDVINESDFDNTVLDEFDIPILGKFNAKDISLLLVSIIMGFLDGMNPCAMWVLLLLISILIPTKDKKKIWILGGAFLLTSALFYFVMMMSWVSFVSLVASKQIFMIIVGIIAIGLGGYQLYKYIKSCIKKEIGCDVTSQKQKKKIITKMKQIISNEKLIISVVGICGIALMVNFIELACSAGMPVMFSNILAINNINTFGKIIYTLIYVLFFLVDDLIIFMIAAFTLRVKGISNKFGKISSLISAILMILIGILMLFFPNILMLNF